jgi:hypothetical protein
VQPPDPVVIERLREAMDTAEIPKRDWIDQRDDLQRRARWRRTRRLTAASAAALLSAAAVIAVVAVPVAHRGSDSTSTLNTTMKKTYTSPLLKYQMSYPARWTLKSATHPWLGGPRGDRAGRHSDEYDSPGRKAFLVTSQQVPAGMTDRQWFQEYDTSGETGTCWPPIAQWQTTTIAGHTAWLHGGTSWCDFIEAVTFVNGRAYVFTGSGGAQCCHRFDQGEFESFLATVKFPGDETS